MYKSKEIDFLDATNPNTHRIINRIKEFTNKVPTNEQYDPNFLCYFVDDYWRNTKKKFKEYNLISE